MKIQSKLVLAVLALVAIPAFAQAPAGAVKAKSPYSAYAQEAGGTVVRSGYGLCWHTGYWKEGDAIPSCESGKVMADAQSMSLDADDLFDYNSAVVKPAAKTKLDSVAKDLKGMNVKRVTVTGHTDSKGSDAYNQGLSERRAKAVKAYLVSKGVSGKKIVTKGKGESQPVADNATEEGRRQNRRVTIEVVGTAK